MSFDKITWLNFCPTGTENDRFLQRSKDKTPSASKHIFSNHTDSILAFKQRTVFPCIWPQSQHRNTWVVLKRLLIFARFCMEVLHLKKYCQLWKSSSLDLHCKSITTDRNKHLDTEVITIEQLQGAIIIYCAYEISSSVLTYPICQLQPSRGYKLSLV